MADGLLSFFSCDIEIFSAGTNPEAINSFAIKVMNRLSIDISKNSSNLVDDYINIEFDYVLTLCDNAKKIFPKFSNVKKIIHKNFLDPANSTGSDDEKIKIYVKVRDQLSKYLKEFTEKELN